MSKRWSKIRQKLEQDFLADALKGRVSYFVTRYNTAHDHGGRVCVLVDKKEILNMPFSNEYEIAYEMRQSKAGGKNPVKLYSDVRADFHSRGVFEPSAFGEALEEYFGNSIEDSLRSDNPLVRMLAFLDRRVGKRTLEKLKTAADDLPEWLRYFYLLRLESEMRLTAKEPEYI
jgi:hypothetical protein